MIVYNKINNNLKEQLIYKRYELSEFYSTNTNTNTSLFKILL